MSVDVGQSLIFLIFGLIAVSSGAACYYFSLYRPRRPAAIRELVERDLDDTGNDIWSTDDVDRAIERALVDYSQAHPQQSVSTLELSADGREVNMGSISGLTRVVKVWYPYDSCAPESPPNWVRWDKWGDVLYLSSDEEPASGATVRIFYHKVHTVEGLGEAQSTSVPSEDEEALLLGAAAYAVLQKARGSVGKAGISSETPESWLNWAENRMQAFEERLQQVRKRELRRIDKRVPLHREGWEVGQQEGGI
jgi:hypothetical protein